MLFISYIIIFKKASDCQLFINWVNNCIRGVVEVSRVNNREDIAIVSPQANTIALTKATVETWLGLTPCNLYDWAGTGNTEDIISSLHRYQALEAYQ